VRCKPFTREFRLSVRLNACIYSINPVVNEVEMHPELQQSDMLRFGAAFGVHIIGCFPFGSPVHTAHGASTSPDEPLADHMLNCDTISNIAKRHRSVLPSQLHAAAIFRPLGFTFLQPVPNPSLGRLEHEAGQ
jgi:diketogulonate reductase-like aldo/keto reductase